MSDFWPTMRGFLPRAALLVLAAMVSEELMIVCLVLLIVSLQG